MKKIVKTIRKSLKIALVFLLSAVTMLSLFACGGKDIEQGYGAVWWTGDNEYAVKVDGEAVDSGENGALLRLAPGSHEITVVTEEGKTLKRFTYLEPELSEKRYNAVSELAEPYENAYFSSAEHLVIDYRGSGKVEDNAQCTVNIAASVKKVSILSDKLISVVASFVIQSRSNDIVFELENINLLGLRDTKNVIEVQNADAWDGRLIIKAYGLSNSIVSGFWPKIGQSGAHSTGTAFIATHAGDGGKGEDGGNAISARNLVILSDRGFQLRGGNGGYGGEGGDAAGYNNVGNGGPGGNGGSAVIATGTVEVFSARGEVQTIGGSGGLGGPKGNRDNGYGISDESRYNGAKGADGAGVSAETVKYLGREEENE